MGNIDEPVVVGIDVGGPAKGLHAVALEGGRYRAQLATRDIGEMVHWAVRTQQATVIAIDAPCGWSADGRGRPAELALIGAHLVLLHPALAFFASA